MVFCCFSTNSTDLAIQLKETSLQLSAIKRWGQQCAQVFKALLIYIIHVLFRHGRKLMSTSIQRKCMGWNKTEVHIRNDNHAFVVKTPPGTSTALPSHRTINLEELSIKLRNWNLFWFATLPNKCPGARRELIPLQAQTDFLCLHFVSKQDISFSRSSIFLSPSLNLQHPYPATASPSRFHTHLG